MVSHKIGAGTWPSTGRAAVRVFARGRFFAVKGVVARPAEEDDHEENREADGSTVMHGIKAIIPATNGHGAQTHFETASNRLHGFLEKGYAYIRLHCGKVVKSFRKNSDEN